MEKNKIENINLHDLVENQDNPRSIEPQQMQKLVESILTFPKMLQMRPIVCNETLHHRSEHANVPRPYQGSIQQRGYSFEH